jgi:hypothetical protein
MRTSRRFWLGPALGLGVVAAACGGTERGGTQAVGDRPAAGTDAAVERDGAATLTGCIERGAIPGTYVLSAEDPSPSSGTGEGRSAGAAGSERYTVTSTAGDLSQHVGQRVKVTGQWLEHPDRPELGTGEAAGEGGARGTTGRAGARVQPHLQARSVEPEGGGCTP